MESSPSQETDNKSAGILSTLLPVATTGELSSRLTRAREQSSTQVSGPAPGCPQISVGAVLAILMVHTSVCPTFAFQVPWFKAQNPKSVQDHRLPLLLHPHQRLPLLARVRLQWARTMTEPICNQVLSTLAVLRIVAAIAQPLMVVLATHGSTPTTNAG